LVIHLKKNVIFNTVLIQINIIHFKQRITVLNKIMIIRK